MKLELKNTLHSVICDPFDGPFEGEDYYIGDEAVHVDASQAKIVGIILRKVNTSGLFAKKLVQIGRHGDFVALGFDEVGNKEPIYSTRIGPNKEILAEVRSNDSDILYLYLNNYRKLRKFSKLSSAKRYITKLDNALSNIDSEEPEFDEE